jgi:serine protease AprX
MKRRSIATVLTLTLLFLPLLTTVSKSAPPVRPPVRLGKISPALAATIATSNTDLLTPIIILTNGAPSFLLKTLITLLGGTITREFTLLNGLAAIVPLGSILKISLDLSVISVTPDRPMNPLMDVTSATVGADVAQQSYGLNGSGIGVAVIDSGINGDDEDLKSGPNTASRVVYSENFVQNESTVRDLYGHGTHVAGIIAGDGTSSSGSNSYKAIKGIAPRAKLINLRVLGSKGNGEESDVLAAIEKAINLKSTYNIRIINLSLGAGVTGSYNRDPLCKAVKLAWDRGLLVVVSAGNYGNTEYGPYGLITSPGNSPYVITVGATNSYATADPGDDTITTYSSRGPTLFDYVVKPDLVAPGNRVKSLLAKGSALDKDPMFANNHVDPSYYLINPSGKSVEYFSLSGTSMAAPAVSGAAALMLQRSPSINNHTVKLRLMASAKKIFTNRYDMFTVGAGLLDIPAALQNTGTAGNSKSPYVKRDPNSTNLYMVVDGGWNSSSSWGTSVIWGGNIGGSSVIWGGNVVWDNSVIWGGGTPFDDDSFSSSTASSQRTITANGD